MNFLIAIVGGVILLLSAVVFLSAGMLMEEGRDKSAGVGVIIAALLLTSGFILAVLA